MNKAKENRMKAKVVWNPDISGMGFEGTGPSGHKLVMDTTDKFGGADKGVRPFEILLLGLGGCTGMDVISILRKKKIEVKSFTIELEAERAEDYPKEITEITLNYKFSGKGLKKEAVERAIELSQDKYCGVSETLRKNVEINHTYVIEE